MSSFDTYRNIYLIAEINSEIRVIDLLESYRNWVKEQKLINKKITRISAATMVHKMTEIYGPEVVTDRTNYLRGVRFA